MSAKLILVVSINILNVLLLPKKRKFLRTEKVVRKESLSINIFIFDKFVSLHFQIQLITVIFILIVISCWIDDRWLTIWNLLCILYTMKPIETNSVKFHKYIQHVEDIKKRFETDNMSRFVLYHKISRHIWDRFY